ncbi:hypothetical protein ACWCYY_39650 [Kitasatospora sp. NPDC001664]
MGERVRAPRRFGGRGFAAVAALAVVLVGGVAVPASHAEGGFAPSLKAAGDLTGDGRTDVMSVNSLDLTVLPAGGAPYTASTAAQSPAGVDWGSYQVTRRGSATGTGTDDLYAFERYGHVLYLYPNDANSGGRPGYFTKKDKAVKVAKPATCAAGTDCTGYDPTWNSATQVVATDGIANKDGMPDLVTVEGGRLWYYPGKAGGAVIGAPVQLSGGGWADVPVIAPGKVGGVPTLWAQYDWWQPVVSSYRLELGANGLPVGPLRSPDDTFLLQNGERDTGGAPKCFSMFEGGVVPCKTELTGWQLYADGTLRQGDHCLSGGDEPARVGCLKSDARVWKPAAGGGLVNASGSCLAARADTVALEPCDGSVRQRWGRWSAGPAADPLPLPEPLAVVNLPEDSLFTGYVPAFGSPGDLDGDGNPELSTQSDAIVVYKGAAPVAGVAGFAGKTSYGRIGRQLQTVAWPTWTDVNDVFYSACVSLTVDQGGSLVVTELATGKVLWSSETPGHVGGRMVLPEQGAFQLQDARGTVYWSAPTPANALSVLDDCNVVLRDRSGVVGWSTRTYDPAHETRGVPLVAGRTLKAGEQLATERTALAMGADGNLVLTDRQSAKVLWTSGTEGRPGAVATLQTDGNLVIRDAAGAPVWSSETWGAAGVRLVVQTDGDLVLYDVDGVVRWTTGTRFDGPWTPPGTVVPSGRTVRSGETVESAAARLVMQPDGNLVLYSKATGNARWSTKTWGNNGATATVQSDGNVVVKAADGRALWASGTWTQRNARLVVQDDLDLVVRATDGRGAWASGTGNTAGVSRGIPVRAGSVLRSGEATTEWMSRTALTMQADGNLVLSTGTRGPVWSSRTWGNSGARATLQQDGNLVVYAADGRGLWSTGTWGHPSSVLVVQGDGNLVLYDADGVPLWATGTSR